jgi:hypothetical protein
MLDTLLLKQKNLPVLDITGFFYRIRTQVTALVHPIQAASFVSIVLYLMHNSRSPNVKEPIKVVLNNCLGPVVQNNG